MNPTALLTLQINRCIFICNKVNLFSVVVTTTMIKLNLSREIGLQANLDVSPWVEFHCLLLDESPAVWRTPSFPPMITPFSKVRTKDCYMRSVLRVSECMIVCCEFVMVMQTLTAIFYKRRWHLSTMWLGSHVCVESRGSWRRSRVDFIPGRCPIKWDEWINLSIWK